MKYQVVVADIETMEEAHEIADAVVVLLYDRNPENSVTIVYGDDEPGTILEFADNGDRGPRRDVTPTA